MLNFDTMIWYKYFALVELKKALFISISAPPYFKKFIVTIRIKIGKEYSCVMKVIVISKFQSSFFLGVKSNSLT
jgi:hypothetical protein